MSKTFFEMMDGVLEEYAAARAKQIPGIDQAHYYKTLRAELTMQVQKWFIKHVEAIHDHRFELETIIMRSNSTDHDVPRDKTGVEL